MVAIAGGTTHLGLAGVGRSIHQSIHRQWCIGLLLLLLCTRGATTGAVPTACMLRALLCLRSAAGGGAACRGSPAAAAACRLLLAVRLIGLQAGPGPLPRPRLVLLLPPVRHGRPSQLASKVEIDTRPTQVRGLMGRCSVRQSGVR